MGRAASISRFVRDDAGGVLAFWGVCLTVFLGLVALSFDVGRVAVTQTELQSFADHVALAAAGELDGRSDAITRASEAADELIADYQTFGSGGHDLSGDTDFTLTFLSSLPTDDNAATTAVTTNPARASFVRVDVNAETVALTFGAAFAALSGQQAMDNVVGASATAGNTSYACDVAPMGVCLPNNWKADAHIGQMIQLRAGGNGAAWTPGDFGFLDPSKILVDTEGPCKGLTGGNLDRCLIGAAGPITQCYSNRGVDIEPGQKTGNYEAAINTRFDMYNSSMNGKKNDAAYAPAPNVIKGIVPSGGGSCIGNNEAVSPNTIGLPRDACFGTGNCNALNGGQGARYGTGDWDRDTYFATNYSPFDGTVPAGIQGWLDANAADPSAPTRYEVYRAEVALPGAILSGAGSNGGPVAESGRPICNTKTNPAVDYSRRVIVVAGINCGAQNISGAASDVTVTEYVKVFLTEPASNTGSGNTFDIWGEVIGSAGANGGDASVDAGIFRNLVQLYR